MLDTARVIEVQVVGDHRLLLTFEPRFTAELEFSGASLKGAPPELAIQANFETVALDALGQLVWPGSGYTIDSDALYERAKHEGGLAPPAPPGATAGGDAAHPAGGDGGSGTSPLVTLVGALASGLGVLGFVTFAGGVVLWSRFKEMGLPADHALGLVTKAELVATGAAFLVPAVLLSFFVVLIAMLIGRGLERLIDRAKAQEHEMKKKHETEDALAAKKRSDSLEQVRDPKRVIAPAIVGLVGIGISIASLTAVPGGAFALLVTVSVLGALVVRAGGRLPFPVFCLIAFLTVGTIAITRAYERNSHRLEVLPMAYSRTQTGDATRVEVGYFVAETSDRILFASEPEGSTASPNELREFPRGETDDLEIGELARPVQAERSAAHFAFNLCERLAHLTPIATTSTTTSKSTGRNATATTAKVPAVCPRPYLESLASKAGLPWKADRAERLQEQLAACRKNYSTQRASCERLARRQFGARRSTSKNKTSTARRG